MVHIGVGFTTNSKYLFDQAEQLGIQKENTLSLKGVIVKHLIEKYKLKSLYLTTNFGLIVEENQSVAFFERLILTTKGCHRLDQLNLTDTSTSPEFGAFARDIASDQEIGVLAYHGCPIFSAQSE